jgi:hypothetical protein
MGGNVPEVPLVHAEQVFFLAAQDQLRSFVQPRHPAIAENARNLQDAVLLGVVAAGLQPHPQVLRQEIYTHC